MILRGKGNINVYFIYEDLTFISIIHLAQYHRFGVPDPTLIHENKHVNH